jgi:hypothetical protein
MFTTSYEEAEECVIPMRKMEPTQVGVTVEGGSLVMRTASTDHFEVMNLSNVRAGGCWDICNQSSMVRLLEKGTVIKLVVS